MDPVGVAQTLTVYKEYGIAGLFLVMYLITVFMFIKSLMYGREKEVERCEKMASLIEKSTAALKEQALVMEKLRESVELSQRENEKVLSYFQAKDQHRK